MTHEKLLQLATLVLTDPITGIPLAPTYLFSHTADNQESVIETGVRLLSSSRASTLVIMDGHAETPEGYPGARAYSRLLEERGISRTSIKVIPFGGYLNTLTEANAVVAYALKQKWDKLIIVSPPFHQLRAFISMVTAVRKHNTNLRVYNQIGAVLPWDETARHSQGILVRVRRDLIIEEIRRIEKYTEKGDLLPAHEILEYLKWRDA